MQNIAKRWEIISSKAPKNSDEIINILLKNRGLTTKQTKEDFFKPQDPLKISLKEVGIKESEVKKSIDRIKIAKEKDEHIIIYGDYDADGITGTATLWESLHSLGVFVLPHIPDRFSEGYGLNLESVKKLKEADPKLSLIITVDHGITIGKKVEAVKKLGIDLIVCDHHQKGKEVPKPVALIYTDKICGSAVAWFFAREIVSAFHIPPSIFQIHSRLELAAIGTVADQMPLLGINRSIVKYGLEELNATKRPGLTQIIKNSKLENIGTYEINYIIAPRLNAMGRLAKGIDSLRFLCTLNPIKAGQLAKLLDDTNSQRQRIVEQMIKKTFKLVKSDNPPTVIVMADESYHEGVIGLAAGKLSEEFYRPAVVFSKQEKISKASARSISGFNIIEAIRYVNLHLEGGGHPMAAGFSIETEKIELFKEKINEYAGKTLTEDLLTKKIKIDCGIEFEQINKNFYNELKEFEPIGLGNPGPTFCTKKINIIEAKSVGREGNHLKLKLEKDGIIFDSIYFNGAGISKNLSSDKQIDAAYQIEENIWNGKTSLQLKIRDVHF